MEYAPRLGIRLLGSMFLMLIAASVFFFLSPRTHAATLYWRGAANTVAADRDRYEDKNNWSSHPRGPSNVAAAPTAGDVAVFNFSGTTVRLRSNVNLGAGGGLVITNVWTGSILQGTGVLKIGTAGWRMGSGTFVGSNTGAINNAGALTLTGGVIRGIQGTSLGAMNMSGNLSINSVDGTRPQFTLTGTLILSGNASQNVNIGQHRVTAVIKNLSINNSGAAGSNLIRSTGSGMSLSGAVTVTAGVLDLTKTSQAQPLVVEGGMTIASLVTAGFRSAGNVTLSGSLIARATSIWSHTGGTFTFNSDNPQTIALYGGGRRFQTLVINNSGTAGTQNRVYMSGANLFASGSLTVTAGTLDLMTHSQTLAAKGGITIADSASAVLKSRNDITMSGSLTIGTSGTLTSTGGTFTFNADNPQTATINSSNHRFNNVTINNTAGTTARNIVTFGGNAFTLSGSVAVTVGSWDATTNTIVTGIAGNITVADSALARFLTAANLTLSGGLTVKPAATFTQSLGTTFLDATSQTLSGSMTFYNLQRNAGGGTTILFYPSGTYTYAITNSLNLGGASASSKLTMKSVVDGQRWRISPTIKQTITNVVLKDSNNVGVLNETCLDCTDSGNNLNWAFEATPIAASGGSSGGSSGGGGGGGGGSSYVSPQGTTGTVTTVSGTAKTSPRAKSIQKRIDAVVARIAKTKNLTAKKILQRAVVRLQKMLSKLK